MSKTIIAIDPVEKAWDWHARGMPEDTYDLEKEYAQVAGKRIMFEKDFKIATQDLMRQLFKEIEHGDKEHRKWLKDKIKAFIKKKRL